MAHKGEYANGTHYSRGFKRLRPDMATKASHEKGHEETSKERMLREVAEEAARRRARVIPDQPTKPVEATPPPPPVEEDELAKEVKRQEAIRSRFKALAPKGGR